MRRLVVNTLALAVVLAGVSMGFGQQQGAPPKRAVEEEDTPKPKKPIRVEEEEDAKPKSAAKKSKLEDMLAEALKNNPDIRVAAARVAKAEAELNRTRLQVTQQVVSLYYAIDTQKKVIALQEEKNAVLDRRLKSGQGTMEAVADGRQTLTLAKAKLAELEAQLPALLGTASDSATNRLREMTMRYDTEIQRLYQLKLQRARTDGPLAERIRKALQTPVKVDYKEVPFADVLKDLEKKAPGLSIRDFPRRNDIQVTLRFEKPLPVSAILQALADDYDMGFFVRDYGIRVTSTRAAPPGMMTVEEFLRHDPARDQRDESKAHNPPSENVEGVVKEVHASGLMTISIGSDAGLAKGHTLELYRLAEQPGQSKYLGTIRIVEVNAKEAAAQPVGRLADKPRAGDRVARRIVGK